MTPRQRFGRELRRWRELRGLSQSELGRRVNLDKSVISRIETGQRAASPDLARACDRELDTGGALLALVPAPDSALPHEPVGLGELGLPPVPDLVGRAEQLDEVRRAIDTARAPGRSAPVCVLRGMAGVGKTALALTAAHDLGALFPDGRVYRDLGGDTTGLTAVSPEDLLEWLLRHLRVGASAMPTTLADRAALFRGRVRGKRILLVLDNVRHVEQVSTAIPAEPGCAVVITTRGRLPSLDHAHFIDLPLLTAVQSRVLLDRLLPAVADLADERVDEILRRCGNLPLAIQVAAGIHRRAPHLGLAGVLDRIGPADRPPVLSDGDRDVLLVLRGAMTDSSAAEHRLFALLALHPGQLVTPRIAAALADTDETVAQRSLDLLWDRHLLMSGPGHSFRVHDLLRQVADEELRRLPAADRDAALRRLVAVYLADADAADRIVSPHRTRRPLPDDVRGDRQFPDPATALAWLHANETALVALTRAASARGFHEYCWHLAHVLRGFFFLACRIEPWIATHEVAVRSAEHTGDRWWVATTRANLGLAFAMNRDLDRAEEQYRISYASFEALGDEVSGAHTLGHQAWISHLRGHFGDAVEQANTALRVYRRVGLARNAAIMLREIGASLTALGRFEAARHHLETAIGEFRALELHLDLAMALNNLADLQMIAADPGSAATQFAEAAEVAARCGAPATEAEALRGLGDTHAATGDPVAASLLWTRSLALLEEFTLPGAPELRRRLSEDRAPVPAAIPDTGTR